MALQAAFAIPGDYVDTDVPLTPPVIALLKTQKKLGVFRYVPLPHNSTKGDVTSQEVNDVCSQGMTLGVVQHVRNGLWLPSEHSSDEDGSTAAEWCLKQSIPMGAHLYLDLESIGGSTYETIIYAIGWQRAVIEAGYRAGLYVGYAVPLHPMELYELPGFDTYWSDIAKRRIATRSYAVLQGPKTIIGGVGFDEDVIAPDLLGELPYLTCQSA